MAGRHAHPPASEGRTPPAVLAVVAALLVVVGLAMVALWPDGATTSVGTPAGDQVTGVVESVDPQPCPDPDAEDCGTATVRLTSGDLEGDTVTVPIPGGVGAPTIGPGDGVAMSYVPDNPPETRYAIVDQLRGTQLWVLLIAFVLAVLAFGRWRGLTALLGLSVSFAIILGFVIPAILDGKPPLAVAIVGSAAIVLSVLYLTHGLGRTTTVAVAGTLVSLVITGLLAVVAVDALSLTGAVDDSALAVGQLQGVDLRGLLLAGILIGSLGVLDDVTVTQAHTVEELATANPGYGLSELYGSAIRVGRSHIASVINTIVLAYAGASLPLLVLVVALDDPIGDILTDQLVATELVRSAVGTIGLIAAVPITTAAAALVASRGRRAQKASGVQE
ncbi:YibE/F family protein [Nostocoides sp. F2B08]|uniref:YibE/F family protein n=1 Tax=Nostocoides sp. F2B08 TaxID=2653936 RepID=UPI001262AE1D|nr:YibE/F family protein [Tetrasphaera sp. F2B08]KAB7743965.1 YibE/F family protein [Tetrasphaera sp. F2B08]